MILSGWAAAVILATSASAFAAPITVDGNLTDWVVSIGDNNTSNWTSVLPGFAGPGTTGLLYSPSNPFLEDNNDTAGHGGYLGPNYGGQDYDAEYLAIAISVPASGDLHAATIYMAISTGVRPDNGFTNFSPGDIRIEANGNVYGIEVGGGAGHTGGSPSALQTEGSAGSTYALYSNGYTSGYTSLAGQQAGAIYKNADWINDPIAPQTPVQMDASSNGTLLGLADYAYTRDSLTGQHAMIELSFSASEFLNAAGDLVDFSVAWSPSCGNDLVAAVVSLVSTDPFDEIPVPEPPALLLFALGLSGLGYLTHRVRRAG